ncbi:MAG: hypothetical protein LBC68_13280, partial [Prevotellaceae bacterium]|nr:hypothetical protein [Prevotellaceae bacterium]
AQIKLALPNKPTIRIKFRIINNPTLLKNNTLVQPNFGMSGGGTEFMTVRPVKIQLIDWIILK